MEITLTINGERRACRVHPADRLLDVLRREGYYSVKHGCETGECGACTVLLDGEPVNSCMMLAAQADGRAIMTVEALGAARDLHPLQQAFIETGAIQCGYCTPAQLLAAKALLDSNPNPTEDEVREALAGVLCRCTGYVKPVQAVLRAAAVLRGEEVEPFAPLERAIPVPAEFLNFLSGLKSIRPAMAARARRRARHLSSWCHRRNCRSGTSSASRSQKSMRLSWRWVALYLQTT